jgi:hypothetical protein
MRCDASTQGLHLVSATMPDAEELVRTAPRGSIPWAQAMQAYYAGLLFAGRIPELLASIQHLGDVEPAPGAVGRVALVLLNGIWNLDNLGHVVAGSALEERFSAVAREAGEREPMAQFWWLIVFGMRSAYAHEDPWEGLQHSDAIQAIYDQTGYEIMLLNMQLFRGLNLWYLGAAEPAERLLDAIEAADETLGPVSSLRRFCLAWLRAERGALAEARALAARLAEDSRAHRNVLDEGRGRWVLAEVLRRAGELEAADREIAAALGMAVALERPGMLGTLAALRLAQGRAAEALATAADAVAQCTAMGGCGLFRRAFLLLVHAEALHATAAHDAARDAIGAARARLHAIAARISDPGYQQSFLEQVPENARTLARARAWLGELAPNA